MKRLPIAGRLAAVVILVALPLCAEGASGAPDLPTEVARIAKEVLASTGVPATSIAVAQGGQIVLAEAFGDAQLEPRTPASAETRFAIGSVSKQFTAAAVLLLVEEQKLSLDDPVARFFLDLERAKDIRVRDLLAHTSGYQDYWPQDFVPPFMRSDIRPSDLVARWTRRGLDFEPGTRWQYSNTGYAIAGLVVEKIAGEPLFSFLEKRIFAPLGMDGVVDLDRGRPEGTASGYTRYGLGPLRPAPLEGRGWLFAAGNLAMRARDLAKWNLAVMERRILAPSSWAEMEREGRLDNGLGTNYGLGLAMGRFREHWQLEHGGAISGFLAANRVFPDDRAAVTVFTNDDVGDAASAISDRIAALLFERDDRKAESEARARRIFADLQRGKIDRALFSENANDYFTEEAIRDHAASLGKLGAPKKVEQTAQRLRGGMTYRAFDVQTKKRTLEIRERDLPDGTIEQFIVAAKR